MEITSNELTSKINNGEKLIIDFWAPWCGPCKVMKPNFDQISNEMSQQNSDVKLYTLNVDENRELSIALGIRSVPTIKGFSNGNEVYSLSGVHSDNQLRDVINKVIQSN
jgi:thioredoxin 1